MKRKTLLPALLALTLAFSFTACGGSDTGSQSSQPESSSESSSDSTEASSSETADTSEPEDTPEPEATEEPSATPEASSETPESSSTSQTASGSADISSAVDGSTSTETSPIALGQWATIADYSAEDETYHNVYVRVTKVTTSTADAAYVQDAVAKSNANGSYYQIDLSSDDYKLPDDVEWCVLDYEVFVPEEYPSSEYGITEPTMSFAETNVGGGGIPSADGTSTYIGIGTNNTDLQNNPSDMDFSVGSTYAFQTLFTMVKGYENYVFELSSYPDGTHSDDTSADIMYYAYFANK